jgi:hypothetical protein
MVSDADSTAVPRPPFPLDRPTSASWREQALSKVAELRFVRDWMLRSLPADAVDDQARRTIDDHLEAAASAAKGGSIWKPRNFVAAVTGSAVERVISQLDAVEGELLRIAPSTYLRGEISSLLAHVQLHLQPNDPRRTGLEALAERLARDDDRSDPAQASAQAKHPRPWRALRRSGGARGATQQSPAAERTALSESDRQAVVSAVRAASSESRWKVSRLRSFRNVIAVASLMLTAAAVGMIVFAFRRPADLPVCFTPGNVVCTTSTTPGPPATIPRVSPERQEVAQEQRADAIMRRVASGWDAAVVEIVGLVAAAIAAAAALRNVRGTSTPYSLPVALAVLKLPTGALTALLGLLLMRGGFVPGLSALDSSAQIIAWALVFGYSQQLLTRLVDNQAQTVLQGAGGNTKSLAGPPHGDTRSGSTEP